MWLGGAWLGTVWRWWVPGLSCPLHWPSELWQEALLAADVAGGDANDRTNLLITTEREKRERVNRGGERYRKMEHQTERQKGESLRSDELWLTAVWHDYAKSRHHYHNSPTSYTAAAAATMLFQRKGSLANVCLDGMHMRVCLWVHVKVCMG